MISAIVVQRWSENPPHVTSRFETNSIFQRAIRGRVTNDS